ncbi:MAG TPA: hypothetical protein VMV86_01745 [Methanosarcinales archaeon]|nr:hypothetical protein [Methanosarcinales archaeon]
MTDKQLRSEISLRCGDAEFKDFEPQIYDRAIYRCNRDIAKQYGILQKTLQFTLRDMVSDAQDDVPLTMSDFKAEVLVVVNGITLIKVSDKLENDYKGVYYMEFKEGTWYFNYTLGISAPLLGFNVTGRDITEIMSHDIFERIEEGEVVTSLTKALDDSVTIVYNIIPDLDSEIGEFDIPTKFEEEQIEKCMYYMAKLGMAKYPGENEKALKYQNLIKMYKMDKVSEYDKLIAKDSEWVKIQPWSVV